MNAGRGRHVALLLVLLLGGGVAVGQEPYLLNDGSDGILDLENENRLVLDGLAGTLSLRTGTSGELRYAARNLDSQRSERSVALWLDGRTLTFRPADESAEPLLIEVAVPPEINDVRLYASDSVVKVKGLTGRLRVRGSNLRLTGQKMAGGIEADLSGGSFHFTNVFGDLTLEGKNLEARVEMVKGVVSLDLAECQVELINLRSDLDAELAKSTILVAGVAGVTRLELDEGTLEITSALGGGRLSLTEAPLVLRQTAGSFEVRTDSDVQFNGHDGPLTIHGFESQVRGVQATGGLLDVTTDHAEVHLDEIESPAKISGDSLDVRVSNTKGNLTIETVSSTIRIENAHVGAVVTNEFGDIEILNASGRVQVFSRDGVVKIDGQNGPADVKADGPEVTVQWASIPGAEKSSIENDRGDVRLGLPLNLRMQVDAHAPFGRIETDIPELVISQDGHTIGGVLRAGGGAAVHVKKPLVQARSGGDLYLLGATRAAAGQ